MPLPEWGGVHMADEQKFDPTASLLGRPLTEFPTPAFPVVYSDGVVSLVPTAPIVKFYLYRLDPNIFAQGGSNVTLLVQIIMPTPSFVATAIFFQQQLERMLELKLITKEQVDPIKSQILSSGKQNGGQR
jgi:hypothetical protein